MHAAVLLSAAAAAAAPSAAPSSGPTAAPSAPPGPPSLPPSAQPSSGPSAGPTAAPRLPTQAPSSPPAAPSAPPTRRPSSAPTAAPTRGPSAAPTAAPAVPTAAPTVAPAAPAVPTAAPSAAPAVPTAAPSAAPAVPTAAPSASPATPSVAPTAAPSAAPAVPTAAPSAAPATPTVAPTAAPAVPATPTAAPAAPTAAPSAAPATPTVAPSVAPAVPAATPSAAPSAAPATPPTAAPAAAPTAAPLPAGSPTRAPAAPSLAPTAAPSAPPTAAPLPAGSPTRAPVAAPSLGPTAAPRSSPSASPSAPPTAAPLQPAAPTRGPESVPTAAPSTAPSAAPQPAGSPTRAPNGAPTAGPTSAPSTAPRPAGSPTAAPASSPTDPPQPGSSPTRAPTAGPSAAPRAPGTPSAAPGPAGGPTAPPLPAGSPTRPPAAAGGTPTAGPAPQGAPTTPPVVVPTMQPTAPPYTPLTPSAAPRTRPSSPPSGSPAGPPTVSPSGPTAPPVLAPSAAPEMKLSSGRVLFMSAVGLHELDMRTMAVTDVLQRPRASPSGGAPAVGGICGDPGTGAVFWTENGATSKLLAADPGNATPAVVELADRGTAQLHGCAVDASESTVYFVEFDSAGLLMRLMRAVYTSFPVGMESLTTSGVPGGVVEDATGLGVCRCNSRLFVTFRSSQTTANSLLDNTPPSTSVKLTSGVDAYAGWVPGGQVGHPVCDESRSEVLITDTTPWKSPPRDTALVAVPTAGGVVSEVLPAPSFLPPPSFSSSKSSLQPALAVVADHSGWIVYTGDGGAAAGSRGGPAPDGILLAKTDAGGKRYGSSTLLWRAAAGSAMVDAEGVGPVVWLPAAPPRPTAAPTAATQPPTLAPILPTVAPSLPPTAPPKSPPSRPPWAPGDPTAAPVMTAAPSTTPSASPSARVPTGGPAPVKLTLPPTPCGVGFWCGFTDSPSTTPTAPTQAPSNSTPPSASPTVRGTDPAPRFCHEMGSTQCTDHPVCAWLNDSVCDNATCDAQPVPNDSAACLAAACDWDIGIYPHVCVRRGITCTAKKDAVGCVQLPSCTWTADSLCAAAAMCGTGDKESCGRESGCYWDGYRCVAATPAPTEVQRESLLTGAVAVMVALGALTILLFVGGLAVWRAGKRLRDKHRARHKSQSDESSAMMPLSPGVSPAGVSRDAARSRLVGQIRAMEDVLYDPPDVPRGALFDEELARRPATPLHQPAAAAAAATARAAARLHKPLVLDSAPPTPSAAEVELSSSIEGLRQRNKELVEQRRRRDRDEAAAAATAAAAAGRQGTPRPHPLRDPDAATIRPSRSAVRLPTGRDVTPPQRPAPGSPQAQPRSPEMNAHQSARLCRDVALFAGDGDVSLAEMSMASLRDASLRGSPRGGVRVQDVTV
eukprot:TRINITY_DN5617_c1_g1_i1.p1 TRINITY_DN5617_c1_g1~~TRINITY_DN5617_c1_g1_i1.p1  ORF type:complete len:1389 (+),score=470.80 TRINITY_DN5617_c1_g1_i1:41-4207(+)